MATAINFASPIPPGQTVNTRWTKLLDRLLTDGEELDTMLVDDESRSEALPRLLAVGVAGLLLFGLAVGVVAELHGSVFSGSPLIWVPLSLTGGFFTAIAVGLPSFYFYTQLAGLDASFRLVTAQAVRMQARTSLLLFAALPFYAAFALGSVLDIGWVDALLTAATFGFGATPAEACIRLGFVAPFFVGLIGLRSTHRSFGRLVKVLPITHPRRGGVLLRMLLAWGAVVAAIAPIAMYRIAEFLITVT